MVLPAAAFWCSAHRNLSARLQSVSLYRKLGVARVTFPDTEKTSAIMYLFSMPWPKKSPGKRNAAGATHVAWSVGGLGRGDQRDVIAQT